MKKSNITTVIGTLNLNDIFFADDTLDIFISIDSVSSEVQNRIYSAIEVAKSEYSWIDKNTEMQLSLWVKIKNKAMTYCISVDFINSDNDNFATVNISIDLAEYESDLKKIIIKAMINNFF